MLKIIKASLLTLVAITITGGLLLSGCTSAAVKTTTPPAAKPTTILPTVSLSPSDQVKYQKILADSVNGVRTLETYRYDINMDMNIDTTGGKQPGNMKIKTATTGGTDTVTNESVLSESFNITGAAMGSSGPQTVSYDIYLVKDWAYMRLNIPGTGEQWVKALSSDIDKSFSYNMAQDQMGVLDKPANMGYLRTEKVNGVDCDVLAIQPTPEEMAQWYNEQGNSGVIASADYADIFKDFTVICYITQDTGMLVKMTLAMTLNLTAEQAKVSKDNFDSVAMTIAMEMIIHDQNQPFSVTLPDAAAKATEVPGKTFSSIR